MIAMTVGTAVAAIVGVGALVAVTSGVAGAAFGDNVGGTCARDTGRASATFTSDDANGRCPDSIGPVRIHMTIAANPIGIASSTPKSSLKRIAY